MFRRIGVGLLWFVALSIVIGLLVAIVAGLMASGGGVASQSAYEAGYAAGAAASWVTPYVLAGSAILSVVGTVTGFLPCTSARPRVSG